MSEVFRVSRLLSAFTVLPHDAIRQAPLDRVGERPMRRAALSALEELLAGQSAR